ncbi:hypothetical protein EBB07_08875 [Paenibacillaceae bacterium]|nr:hypothetical protein EBB07_08875 [Paenibacillaceae bacterium]
MKRNKYLAWLLIFSMLLSISAVQLTPAAAEELAGFAKGNDLVVKTNILRPFVTYTTNKVEAVKPAEQPVTFKDKEAIAPWALEAVDAAAKLGLIQGSNGSFKPKSTITRAEFSKILVAILGLELKSEQGASFKDVDRNDWFYPYVNTAYEAGLMKGYNNQFQPNDKMTREQMASTLARALNLSSIKVKPEFKDMDAVAAWAKSDVEAIVAFEIMLGDNNRFKPKDAVTREMTAVVAMRAYEYKQEAKVEEKEEGKQETGQEQEAAQESEGTPEQKPQHREAVEAVKQTAAFLQKSVTNPIVASIGGEWTVLGLARSDVKVPEAYYAKYYANLEQKLKETAGQLHHVKYTEYDRVILALTALGKPVDNVAGYNLTAPLADFETVIKQGINGPIFALIALDSKQYDIPVVPGVKKQTTRELLIEFILNREIAGGGWALGSKPTTPDPDITAMAIQGLTPYYAKDAKVKAAVDRGIAWLSKAQKADGGFMSWGAVNSESIAQVIVALSGMGINPHTDARFIKSGHSAVDALLGFASEGGGFYHIKAGGPDNGGAKPGEVDLMASDQALYALVAYNRLLQGQSRLYDMTDVGHE